jgi:hypothetical protein
MTTRRGPTDEQLAAAIEGARNMPEANRAAGRVVGADESSANPAEETGATEPVEPDEVIKRETAVFLPGTHGKKPQAK